MKCPLISSQYGAHNCVAPDCALTDEAGHCLVKQALQCYVSAERTRIAEENERLRRSTEVYKFMKDGSCEPIHFLHQPIDENHRHGGVFEDLSDLRGITFPEPIPTKTIGGRESE